MHEYFEDIEVDDSLNFGSYEVTSEEIRTFAEQYDPQPFHLRPDHDGPFDGLVASGWHTAAMTMRLLVDNYLAESGARGSPGLEELRWPAPVEPGDTLSATVTILETDDWSDDYGVGTLEIETTTSDGTTVCRMVALTLYRRSEASP